jgi:hypothetical protein
LPTGGSLQRLTELGAIIVVGVVGLELVHPAVDLADSVRAVRRAHRRGARITPGNEIASHNAEHCGLI